MALAAHRERFTGVTNSQELICRVKELMPLDSGNIKHIQVQGTTNKFIALIECSINLETRSFIDSYCAQNQETLRHHKTQALETDYYERTYLKCHHKTSHVPTMNPNDKLQINPAAIFKNTSCPFSLVIRRRPDNTCMVNLNYEHNHSVTSLQVLSFRDLSLEVKDKIVQLFKLGYPPSKAYHEYIRELNSKYPGSTFQQIAADRYILPKRHDFNNLYDSYVTELYGQRNSVGIYNKLKGKIYF